MGTRQAQTSLDQLSWWNCWSCYHVHFYNGQFWNNHSLRFHCHQNHRACCSQVLNGLATYFSSVVPDAIATARITRFTIHIAPLIRYAFIDNIYHVTVVLSPLMVSTNSSCWPLSAWLRTVSCFPPKPIHFNRSNSSANNFQFINSSSQIESDIRTAEGRLLHSIFKIPVLDLPIDSIS